MVAKPRVNSPRATAASTPSGTPVRGSSVGTVVVVTGTVVVGGSVVEVVGIVVVVDGMVVVVGSVVVVVDDVVVGTVVVVVAGTVVVVGVSAWRQRRHGRGTNGRTTWRTKTMDETRIMAAEIRNWDECHKCGGEDLQGAEVDIVGRFALQAVQCSNCDASFVEEYVAHQRIEDDDNV